VSRDPDPASDDPTFADFHLPPRADSSPRDPRPSCIAALIALTASSCVWLPAFLWHPTTPFASGPTPIDVLLGDGSRCRLAPDTQITLGKDPTALDLTLITGAVLCDMAPNPVRNFTVFANGVRIKDVGTIFAVMRTMSGVKVTVVAGSVLYSPSSAAKLPLVRNQQAFIAGDQSVIEKLSQDEMRLELAMEFGDIQWKGVGLFEAARVINWYNRHDPIKIVVSPEVDDLLIGGNIPHPEHPERFVKGYVGSHPNVANTTVVNSDRTTVMTLHSKTP
jgi:ferric-dicitrate binding protein FerR (iron transport regulator)